MQELKSAVSSGISLNFGMMNLTVSAYAAVGADESSAMKIVCTDESHAPSLIKTKVTCPVCESARLKAVSDAFDKRSLPGLRSAVEVLVAGDDKAKFGKAKQMEDGGLVVIPAEMQAAARDAAAANKKKISLTIHPEEQVSAALMPSGKSYYLWMKAPNQDSIKTYNLLVQTLLASPDKAFMCKLTLSSATSLFQLIVAGEGTLVLRQMAEAALVRKHPDVVIVEPNPRLVEMATMMAEEEMTDFLVAEHGTGKSSIIAEYAAAQTSVAAAGSQVAPATGGSLMDLTAALEARFAAKQQSAAKPRRARKVS